MTLEAAADAVTACSESITSLLTRGGGGGRRSGGSSSGRRVNGGRRMDTMDDGRYAAVIIR
ncbi:hypothetical protein AAVH_30057, partial [Aphelenchoides avenae]